MAGTTKSNNSTTKKSTNRKSTSKKSTYKKSNKKFGKNHKIRNIVFKAVVVIFALIGVIATIYLAYTGIRSLVEKEGKFGLWCSSDDIDGFVNAVLKLSGDKALREEMGNKGYTYLKDNFNVQRSVDLIEKSL